MSQRCIVLCVLVVSLAVVGASEPPECAGLASRTDLASFPTETYCSAFTGDADACVLHYATTATLPGQVRLCGVVTNNNGAEVCKALFDEPGEWIDCSATLEALPSALPSPPPAASPLPPGAVTCDDLQTREDVSALGADVSGCFMIDSSHPDVLDRSNGCEAYYATHETKGLKACYLDGDVCKSQPYFVLCSNLPPSAPEPSSASPSPPPSAAPSPPPSPTPPSCDLRIARVDLSTLGEDVAGCYMIDSSHPDVLDRSNGCEAY